MHQNFVFEGEFTSVSFSSSPSALQIPNQFDAKSPLNSSRAKFTAMAEGGGGGGARRPSISLPARSAVESLFRGGVAEVSPGPMTLVSSFFAEDPESECRSFSQLLAGAMASPAAMMGQRRFVEEGEEKGGGEEGGGSLNLGHSRPMNLMVGQSAYFTVPAGLSPGGLLDSPAMFSNLGQFGMSHQQALAQVTAHAAHSNTHIQSQAGYPSSISSASLTQQVSTVNMATSHPMQSITSSVFNSGSALISHCDQKAQPAAIVVDKPVDDGFNWRKYGQKQVKGSEFPRSYYKCTHPKCPVKKKVERSLDGHVTEIIYKGQHNHQRPPPNKRSKDSVSELNGNSDPNNLDSCQQGDPSNLNRSSEGMNNISKRARESGHGASELLTGSSDGEELGDAEAGIDEGECGGESEQKRRNLETRVIESSASHRMVTEPRIIVQTTSEVDLLDDGYRWRKYGQKVVKGNPYPRSYYKCTNAGCNVRKHVERASTDRKAVITTYEGKHNHDVPAARNSSHNTNTPSVPAIRHNSAPHETESNNQNIYRRSDLSDNVQRPIAVLQLKGEHEMT